MTPAQRRRAFGIILRVMSEEAKVGLKMLKSQDRGSQQISAVRYMAMALCRELTGASLPEIGRFFGRDHSTVLHGLQTIDARRTPAFDQAYEIARGRAMAEMEQNEGPVDEWIARVPFRHREVC